MTLKARPELEESLRRTIVDREELRHALVELSGIAAVHPSGGNFVLVDLEGPAGTAATLRNVLLECEAIAIKDVTGRFADGVPRVRLGVRLPEDNARLIAALERRLAPPVVAGARG